MYSNVMIIIERVKCVGHLLWVSAGLTRDPSGFLILMVLWISSVHATWINEASKSLRFLDRMAPPSTGCSIHRVNALRISISLLWRSLKGRGLSEETAEPKFDLTLSGRPTPFSKAGHTPSETMNWRSVDSVLCWAKLRVSGDATGAIFGLKVVFRLCVASFTLMSSSYTCTALWRQDRRLSSSVKQWSTYIHFLSVHAESSAFRDDCLSPRTISGCVKVLPSSNFSWNTARDAMREFSNHSALQFDSVPAWYQKQEEHIYFCQD